MNRRPSTSIAMTRLGRCMAFVLVFMLFPGASEALVDLGHLAFENEAGEHVTACPEDADSREGEHGCSGLFHVCRCCPTQVAVAARLVVIRSASPLARTSTTFPIVQDGPLDGHSEPPFRPPAS